MASVFPLGKDEKGVLHRVITYHPSDKTIKGGFETMNKNLKKVISAVAALALSVTSFVAMASYSDVPATDKHVSAINELSALGVIEGFEDGTFHPDELVTRAQMAAMVCRALNNFSAESNKRQVFNDVAADNWAAGWVATASDNGIINGTGNGNFDPDMNVTYAQTAKMLVSAIGYGTWAEKNGGWPSGYLNYAYSTGVTTNISGVTNDTAITRAQAAQMIANALEAPMCVAEGMTTDYQGNYIPNYVQKDGTNSDKSPFTSLLVKNWDVYVVNGTVKDTGKTDTTTTDTAKYQIEKTKNYLGTAYNTSSQYNSVASNVLETVKKGSSDVDKYLNEYTKALIKADDYSEAEMVYIESAGKATKEEFNSNLYDELAVDGKSITVRKSASTTSKTTYKLADDWSLVVNGVTVSKTKEGTVADTLNKFISEANPGMTVTIIDNPTNGTATDGYYDVITVDYGITAIVDSVVDSDTETMVYFKDAAVATTGIEVKKDDTSYKYTFVKDDVAVNATDLAANNVLTVKYDPNSEFDSSMFYDVVVSDKTVEGKVSRSGQNEYNENFYTIGDTDYVVAPNLNPNVATGNEYTAYLTADGKIAYTEKLASAVNYAIVERVYTATSGEDKVRIVGKDGVRREYELHDSWDDNTTSTVYTTLTAIKNAGSTWAAIKGAAALENRVIDYSLTSDNRIRIKSIGATADLKVDMLTDKAYTASTSRLGSAKLDDATIVLDAEDWWDKGTASVGVVTKNSFVDTQEYTACVVRDGSASASEAVPFVVVIKGMGGWTIDTQMAVVGKTSTVTEDSQERTQLSLYYNGELTTMNCVDTSSLFTSLKEGDAIVFSKDSDGYIDDVRKIMNINIASNRYEYFKAIKAATAVKATNVKGSDDTDKLPYVEFDGEQVEYMLYPVVDKTSDSITLGTDLKVDTVDGLKAWIMGDAGESFSYESNVKVYTYDGRKANGYKVNAGAAGAVAKTMAVDAGKLGASKEWIDLGNVNNGTAKKATNTVAFALVRVHDDRVREVYSITMSDDDKSAAFAE